MCLFRLIANFTQPLIPCDEQSSLLSWAKVHLLVPEQHLHHGFHVAVCCHRWANPSHRTRSCIADGRRTLRSAKEIEFHVKRFTFSHKATDINESSRKARIANYQIVYLNYAWKFPAGNRWYPALLNNLAHYSIVESPPQGLRAWIRRILAQRDKIAAKTQMKIN